MRVAVYQMYVLGSSAENYAKVEHWAELTMKKEPDVLILPEIWPTSSYGMSPGVSECGLEQPTEFLSRLARHHKVNIVGGSIPDGQGEKTYNSAYVFDRSGAQVYCYHKIQLGTTFDEQYHFCEGNVPPEPFLLDQFKAGIAICYELRFPEVIHPLAINGSGLLFVLAAWPLARISHWRALLRARAIENQLFVVGCNRVGIFEGTRLGGGSGSVILGGDSIIFDPFGECVAECDQIQESSLIADLDMELVEKMRKTVPVFRDRRPEVYSRL